MKTEVRQAILGLAHRGIYNVPYIIKWQAEIHRLHEYYILFQIPGVGGEPKYVGTYHYLIFDEMLKKIDSWT